MSNFDWLDFSSLKGIDDEFYEIVKDSDFIDAPRRDAICRGIAGRLEALENIVMSQSIVLLLRTNIGKRGMEEEVGNSSGMLLQFPHERLDLMRDIFGRIGRLA